MRARWTVSKAARACAGIAGVTALAVGLVPGVAGGAAETPVPVKRAEDRGISLSSPAANRVWFGWAREGNYFVQRGDEPRVRVNPKGTGAYGGGIYRQALVYLQRRGDAPSDLYRFDLRTGRRAAFPDRVNMRGADESSPTLSGRYLLFHRHRLTGPPQDASTLAINKVLLYDRTTRRLRVLAKTEFPDVRECPPYLVPGQVNGAYAVWESGFDCAPPQVGEVVLYDIERGTKRVIPGNTDPAGNEFSQESPAVSADGTVYFARQNLFDHTQEIVKKPLGSPAEVLYTAPSNQGASELYVDDRARAHHVYFTLTGVPFRDSSSIYMLIDPLPSP